jgi:regulator of protease activity HflC (stomatin/prohibitin superfamily)
VALLGLVVQAIVALLVVGLTAATSSLALALLRVQIAAGALFWGVTYLHLVLRRHASEEALDLEAAERRRREQGMESLFAEDETGRAAQLLAQMDRYLAPALSLVLALALLSPLLYYLFGALGEANSLAATLAEMPPVAEAYLLHASAAAIGATLVFFLLGTYAAGLARERGWSVLRAGAGAMLSSALFLFLATIALVLASRGWAGYVPDRFVGALVLLWMTAQAVEMLVNFILDFYRPRVAAFEQRPVYDSRLSGLFAEPQGLFRTFAQTMDYQFGFRISETWFFRFLERAFAPLLLIQVLTFYLLTCIVVVRPGEAGIVERWGRPVGLPAIAPGEPSEEVDWSRVAEPLAPGISLKWPWPFEAIRIIPRENVRVLYTGFTLEEGETREERIEQMRTYALAWNMAHMKGNTRYLVPMPQTMERTIAAAPAFTDAEEGATAEAGPDLADALFLSGYFALHYRVGPETRDVYRYAYTHQDPDELIRLIVEREMTAYFAGAEFNSLVTDATGEAEDALQTRIQTALTRADTGIEVVDFHIIDLHPPAGRVGQAYQAVLASRQEREALKLEAEARRQAILGQAPSEALRMTVEAESYRYSRRRLADARAERFRQQNMAWTAAPEVFRARMRLRVLQEALVDKRLFVVAPDLTLFLDDTRSLRTGGLDDAILEEATRD